MATAYRATWWIGDEPVTFIWRSLNWKEYRQVSGLLDYAKYAAVYRIVLIAGPAIEHVPAGIMQWIGRYELDNNPFSGELKPIQLQRQRSEEWAGGYLNAARGIVSWAFNYKFEEIDTWDAPTFFNRLAQAEYVFQKYLFGKPFLPEDPNAPKPPEKKPQKPRLQKLKR